MLFLTRLQQICAAQPQQTALEFMATSGPEVVSYGQLAATVQQTMAYLLSLGVQPGDRVALQMGKCLPFIYLHLAGMRLGAISLPLNPAYPAAELAYFLQDSQARLLFTDTAVAGTPPHPTPFPTITAIRLETADPATSTTTPLIPPPDANNTALMIYTSGTTGRPKGAQLSHGNLSANLDSLHTAWDWQATDVLLHILPLFHVHGLIVALHGALHAGATAVLLPHFDPQQTLETLVQRRCTILMGVPTIHRRLVELPQAASFDLRHVRLITSGSDRLPDDLFHRFLEIFSHTLLERYGLSETGMNLSNPLHGERRCGSVGLPLPGVQVRIAHPDTNTPLPDGQIGEVQVRGPHVFTGYWQMPQKTAAAFTADGWLRTGDLGLRESDGYFTLKGRAKELIISGGLNIYPPEVERVLLAHPAVAAAAVIGCPDAKWGERVTAVLLLHPQHHPTPTDLITYCRQHLAAYKIPRQIIFAHTLPRNALGKIQKGELRQTHCPPPP